MFAPIKKGRAGWFKHGRRTADLEQGEDDAGPTSVPLRRIMPTYVPLGSRNTGTEEDDDGVTDAMRLLSDAIGVVDTALQVTGQGGERQGDAGRGGGEGGGDTSAPVAEAEAEAEAEVEVRGAPAPPPASTSAGGTTTSTSLQGHIEENNDLAAASVPVDPSGFFSPPWHKLRSMARMILEDSSASTEDGHVDTSAWSRTYSWEEEGPDGELIPRIVRPNGEPFDPVEEDTLMSHRPLIEMSRASPMVVQLEHARQVIIGKYEGKAGMSTRITRYGQEGRATIQRWGELGYDWDRVVSNCRGGLDAIGGENWAMTWSDIWHGLLGHLLRCVEKLGKLAKKYWWVIVLIIVLIILIARFGLDKVYQIGKKVEKVVEDVHG